MQSYRDDFFAWEQRKLSDISEKSYEKNTDNKYSTVLTNSAEYGIVKQRDFFDKDIANSSNILGYYVVGKNYFVYNPRISNHAKFGPINRNKLDETGIMSPLYLVFTVHDIDESFLETLFQTTTWHRFMYQNGDTGARADRFAIKDSTFMSMPIKVPSLEEQHKLALAFQKLDQTITLHEEKKRQLERLKSALLQKMFADKSGYPAVRFRRYNTAWKQVELGNLMDVGSVKRIHQSDWQDSGIRFLRARDIVAEYKHEKIDKKLYIDKDIYIKYSILSGKVHSGDLLVTGVGTIGIPMLIKNEIPIYFKDGNIIWFKNNNTINGYFLYYSFSSQNIRNFIKASAGTGTVVTYTIENGKKTPIILPSNQVEQREIGLCFHQLDYLISLYQKKIDRLNSIKQSFLQQMFI